ncbi:MAG: hypothetical protein ACE5LA_05670 [Dehalococcoidales bacterium]
MSDTFIIILMVVIFILVLLVLPQFLVMRAVPKVIRIFRRHNAVGIKNAKTLDELGLKPQTMFDRMFRLRDYKPRALQLLIGATIVQMTEDGKLYLDEENLANTRWRMY